MIKATTIGSNTVQQNDISWSKRILGKLALAQINTNIIKLALTPSIKLDDIPYIKILVLKLIIGNRYPPKNNILVKIHITTILAYSAKKKNTKITAACSVINPLTNSDSASAKSNGARFVSAIAPMKNIKKTGSKGIKKKVIFCASTFPVKFKLPDNKSTNNIAELRISS